MKDVRVFGRRICCYDSVWLLFPFEMFGKGFAVLLFPRGRSSAGSVLGALLAVVIYKTVFTWH